MVGVPRGCMEISGEFSMKLLGNFLKNSGKFPEILGDTRGVQHDQDFDVWSGPK